MYAEEFDGLIKSADERMKLLYRQAGSPPTHQHGLVPETFEELQLALEELQVAAEELRQQNDVLADAQTQLAALSDTATPIFSRARPIPISSPISKASLSRRISPRLS